MHARDNLIYKTCMHSHHTLYNIHITPISTHMSQVIDLSLMSSDDSDCFQSSDEEFETPPKPKPQEVFCTACPAGSPALTKYTTGSPFSGISVTDTYTTDARMSHIVSHSLIGFW